MAKPVMGWQDCWDPAPMEAHKKHYRIAAHPSGQGSIGEYYHYLIEWAAPLLFLLQDAGPEVVLHAPCNNTGGVMPTFAQGHSFKPGWDRIFAQRNQTVTVLREVAPPMTLEKLPWDLQEDGKRQEWSLMDPQIYDNFRKFMWSVAKPDFDKDGGILFIVTKKSKARRRNYENTMFQEAITLAMPTLEKSGVRYQIVEMDSKTQEEQVRLVANARVVIGMHGGSLSNIVFMRPRSLVIEMGLRDFPCFENLAKQTGLRYQRFDEPAAVEQALEAAFAAI